jgi:PAS domain-containing protein
MKKPKSPPVMEEAGFLLSMLDAIPTLTFLVDEDVHVLWLNRMARRTLKLTLAQVRNRYCGDVLHCLHSRGKPGCGKTQLCEDCVPRNCVTQALAGKTPWRVKTTLKRRTAKGTVDLHLLVTASRVQWQGKRLALLMLEDLNEVIELQGLIPICAWCRKVRTDKEYWKHLEEYIHEKLDVHFTHSICPDCYRLFQAGHKP